MLVLLLIPSLCVTFPFISSGNTWIGFFDEHDTEWEGQILKRLSDSKLIHAKHIFRQQPPYALWIIRHPGSRGRHFDLSHRKNINYDSAGCEPASRALPSERSDETKKSDLLFKLCFVQKKKKWWTQNAVTVHKNEAIWLHTKSVGLLAV